MDWMGTGSHHIFGIFIWPPQQKGTPGYHYQVIKGNLNIFLKKHFNFNSIQVQI